MTNLLLLTILSILPTQVESPHVIKTLSSDEIIKIAENIYSKSISKIQNYSGMLVKREYVDGKDTGYQYIEFKFRENPKSIYMKFLKPSSLKDREILYVEGKDVVVKRGGKFNPRMTVTLAANSPLLTNENRYTLNDIGVKVLSERIIQKLKVEAVLPGATIKYFDSAKLDGRPVTLYRLSLSPETKEEANYTAEIAVDKELNIPIYYKAVNTDRKVIEEYLFRNIKLNVDLSDKDFEENNEQYGFRKYEE